MSARSTLALGLLLSATDAAAQRSESAADATVFIRMVGSAHAEIEELGRKRVVDLDRIEIGTGFIISPHGYVLTNHHVVSNSEIQFTQGLATVKVTLQVTRIQTCFAPEAAAARLLTTPCSEASVYASDPALDLAVLFMSGSNLPYLALGDSDVVTPGQRVWALGYPFGTDVEVGRSELAPGTVPGISTDAGTISALRAGDGGERRFLQISSNLNPGNSGGPLVDEEGFVVGVIRMRLAKAPSIGFAIPINQVKDFLETRGLDQLMPTRRLRLGGFQSLREKGLGLRLPDAIEDASPLRARVESDARASEIALRIDRAVTPWTPRQIEESLVSTQQFERLATADHRSQTSAREGTSARLAGHATGTASDTGQDVGMDYAIVDLGAEALIARYVGPLEAVAFNASVLRDSLASLEGQVIRAAVPPPMDALDWSTLTLAGDREVPVPAGWVVEPGAPLPCAGLPPADAAAAAFVPRDFTMALRVAVWVEGSLVPDAAALACSPRRGSLGSASYASRAEWMGVRYSIEGMIVRLGPRQIAQVEVVSIEDRAPQGRTLLAAWMKRSAR
jgi:S1-C subfamily serine protease